MSARRSWTSPGPLFAALLLWLACLFALPAQARDILLVSTEQSPALQDFAEALAQHRPNDQVRLETPENLPPAANLDGQTRLLLLGSGALNWRLASHDAPPALTLLVSRVEARQVLGEREPPHLSLLWSDRRRPGNCNSPCNSARVRSALAYCSALPASSSCRSSTRLRGSSASSSPANGKPAPTTAARCENCSVAVTCCSGWTTNSFITHRPSRASSSAPTPRTGR